MRENNIQITYSSVLILKDLNVLLSGHEFFLNGLSEFFCSWENMDSESKQRESQDQLRLRTRVPSCPRYTEVQKEQLLG